MSKCGKNCYDTKALARKAKKRINRQIKGNERKIRNIYYCGACSAWHLTSMTQEKYNLMVKDFISCSLCYEQYPQDENHCPSCSTENPDKVIIVQ